MTLQYDKKKAKMKNKMKSSANLLQKNYMRK